MPELDVFISTFIANGVARISAHSMPQLFQSWSH